LQQRRHLRVTIAEQDVGLEIDQLFREGVCKRRIAGRPAEIDLHISALGPAEFLQDPQQRRNPALGFRIVCRGVHQHPDPA
jgi:hypothetical protein